MKPKVLVLLIFVICLGVGSRDSLSAQNKGPMGRPLDWSHSHLVASRGGPDHGARIYGDWRTVFRHIEIQQIEALRQAAKETAKASSQSKSWLAAAWLAFPLFGFAYVFAERTGKRKYLIYFTVLSVVAFLVALGCGTVPDHQDTQTTSPQLASTPDVKLDWSINTGGTGPVTAYPSKYSFDISASNCSDVIYFTVNQAGGISAANVIAITNPYIGCPGNATGGTPTIKFGIALTTGTATSAVPSLDGTVLYVFEASGVNFILHAINVNNITVIPGTYNFGTGTWTLTHTLAPPTGLAGSEQLFQITFTGVTNTRSSLYLDYTNNQLFFGDLSGKIHRVINTNLSTASEDTANFPVACGTTEQRSPVFVNGQVISTSADGKVYRINTTLTPPFTCIASAQIGIGARGDLSSPLVDSTNGQIIVTTDNAGGQREMDGLNLMFLSGAVPPNAANLGASSATSRHRLPALDNAFFTTNKGNLYAGGGDQAGTDTYVLRVAYDCTVSCSFGDPVGFAELHNTGIGNSAVSPVSTFLTASVLANPEFVYIGGSSANYRFMNRIATGFGGADGAPVLINGATSATGFFAVAGGVDSGIIIDNRTATVTGGTATANIYFGSAGGGSQSAIFQLAQQF